MDPNRFTTTKFNKEAIDAVYAGAREVASAVSTTLGPLGRNVLIDKGYQTDIIHDGVGVSLIVNPKDPFARNGANIMKEATKKQRDVCGDGTTAACVLTMAILDETLKATSSGINPMTLRKGLESGAEKLVKYITSVATPVKTLEQKVQIATISAEDPDLGRLVAETIHKIGDEGVLTVEESKTSETYVEHQEGMQVDQGYAHPFMVTDATRMTAVLEDAHVLITDHPLTTMADIGSFIEYRIQPKTKRVLFIAPEIGLEFIRVLVEAKMNGKFLGLAMQAPGTGDNKTAILQDLCTLTGATLITKEADMKFEDQQFDVLGTADRIVMSKVSTIITGGGGSKKAVKGRIEEIKEQLKDETLSEFEKEKLRERKAKLTDGVAVIKVAGQTDVEMKERKERAIDAVASVQSACRHGMLPGGEVIYLSALSTLDTKSLGEKILANAIKAPFRKLVENAGYEPGEKYSQLMEKDKYTGFDVMDGKFKNMVAAGIVDSALVPISAIKTAVSVAVQISSVGAAVVLDNIEPK